MQVKKQNSTKSYRLSTKKKFSTCSKTDQDDENNSSFQSQFSTEYYQLTKKLKIKSSQSLNQKKLGLTLSNMEKDSTFRIRTQFSFSKNIEENSGTSMSYMPIVQGYPQQLKKSLSFRADATQTKMSVKLNVQNHTKTKKLYKIQRPSLYCDFQQQSDSISPLKKAINLNKQQELKINSSNSKQRTKILQNCILLWKIRKQLTQHNNKIKPKDIIKSIKQYVMQKQQKGNSIKNMQNILTQQQDQKDFKQLIAYQRIVILGIIQLIRLQRFHSVCLEFVNIINNLMGFYKYLLKICFASSASFKFFQSNAKQYENLQSQMILQNIEEKTSLSSTLLFMCTKINSVYRFSSDLLKKIKKVLNNAKNVSINRNFYDMLTIFAIYLNDKQVDRVEQNKINKYLLSFMTCPSPYIVEPRKNKNYSLVLDLDQTLISTKLDDSMGKSKYCINYRPYCYEFISKLSQFYEIIIFTSSISTYAYQVIGKFQAFVSHVLCREHTIQVKGLTIKDLTKIGRSIETTIIVDNLSHNFKLQSQNGIQIKSWYGDKSDRELQKLQKILIKVIQNNPKDVRVSLKDILT